MSKKAIKIKVFRYDPTRDENPKYVEYEVPHEEGNRVSDALNYIYEKLDHSLGYRRSCGIGCCLVCSVKVNGENVLSCQVPVEEGMVVEPLNLSSCKRDLIT